MQISDVFPYWERERDMFFDGMQEIISRISKKGGTDRVQAIFGWVPGGGVRSISDTMRHIAYVEYYIIEKLIMDGHPKTVILNALFPREEYPTYESVIQLMHDVHKKTIQVYAGLTSADLKREVEAPPPFAFSPLAIDRLLWSIVQEEAHHRGQIYLLLRMQGVPPPQRTD